MEVLSDAEWDDFDRFVETLGPLYVAEEDIVFRGEDIPIDLEYVRKSANDARKAAELHDEVAKMREENAMLLARLQKLEQLASLQVDESRDLASR